MKNKRMNYWIPKWMINTIERRMCLKCKNPIKSTDVIAVGIRELESGKSSLYSEHECSKCSHRSIILHDKEKTGTLQEMCFTLLDSIKIKKKMETALRLTEKIKGDMSDKSVKKFLKFLKEVPTHDAFLKHIGSSLDTHFDSDGKNDNSNS